MGVGGCAEGEGEEKGEGEGEGGGDDDPGDLAFIRETMALPGLERDTISSARMTDDLRLVVGEYTAESSYYFHYFLSLPVASSGFLPVRRRSTHK